MFRQILFRNRIKRRQNNKIKAKDDGSVKACSEGKMRKMSRKHRRVPKTPLHLFHFMRISNNKSKNLGTYNKQDEGNRKSLLKTPFSLLFEALFVIIVSLCYLPKT